MVAHSFRAVQNADNVIVMNQGVIEDAGTIEDVCEPYLMQKGFLQRTPRGRMVTDFCREYFHYPLPSGSGKMKNKGNADQLSLQ